MKNVKILVYVFFILNFSITSIILEATYTSGRFSFIHLNDVFQKDLTPENVSLITFYGESIEDFSGYAVSNPGDVNGDGLNDILIGAWKNADVGQDAGKAYLIFGNKSRLNKTINLSKADASFLGEQNGDQAGFSVSGSGDVNGDGYNDFLIGAYGNDDGGISSGKIYLIFGKENGWKTNETLSHADVSFIGENSEDYSGKSISQAGDVNRDGYDDFLIGAYGNDEGGISSGKTYLIHGKKTFIKQKYDLSEVKVSFIGENENDQSGYSLSGSGDVNGDGYCDFLIGANGNSDGGQSAGKTYLFFGSESKWNKNTDISTADATFLGEQDGDFSGCSVSNAGDTNFDGFNDFLIGAYGNDEGGSSAGKTYLFFGKNNSWKRNENLLKADVSFIGEKEGDKSGFSISGAGDFNCDGYDDIIIGAYENDEGGEKAGQVYLIYGKRNGWNTTYQLSQSNLSVIGKNSNDMLGYSISDLGDVNGDGYEDFVIGAYGNDDYGFQSGITHVVGIRNIGPSEIDSIVTYLDSNPSEKFDKGQKCFLRIIGKDGDNTSRNSAVVSLDFKVINNYSRKISLMETGINTGIYHGFFIVPQIIQYLSVIEITPLSLKINQIRILIDYPYRPIRVDSVGIYKDENLSTKTDILDYGDTAFLIVSGQDANPTLRDKAFLNITSDKNLTFTPLLVCREIGMNTGLYIGELTVSKSMLWFENITATSVRNTTKSDTFMVHTPVQIRPFDDNKTAYEDMEYRENYWNFGWITYPTWTLTKDKDWIQFDEGTGDLYGTPDNTEIGLTTIELNLTDSEGHFSSHQFRINVENADPNLIGTDLLEIDQDEYYEVDYDCDDDGQGEITYYVSSNADWLEMEPRTGVLIGLPENDDVGEYTATVSVTDGNEGWDYRQFNITVNNINDAPVIITDDITEINQDDPFIRNYVADEIDVDDELRWELHTDAGFLTMDTVMGTLSGTPTYLDVGSYFVNVSVWDLSEDYDYHNFTLTVLDINDPPVWEDFPPNVEVVHGDTYLFDANATDYDGDLVTYYISSTPESEIFIDEMTGMINWTADIHLFDQAPYKLEVKVSARDGYSYLNRTFTITVKATEPPTVELLGPVDGTKGASTGAVLSWEGTDPEDEPIIYDVYLHQTEAYVQGYREEALFEEGYEGTSITLDALDPGKRYFWTVIPNDGCSDGLCTSGVMSFRVNYKPTFKEMEDHEVPAGRDFKYKISATDEDGEDLPNLVYSLVEAPDGMTISSETGMIRWTPEDDQVMLHTVSVMVSDGIENNTATFEIEVTEVESSSSMSILIIILIVVIVVILLALGVYLFMKKKKQLDQEALKRGEEERAALEKEEETGPSYEDIYGTPGPVLEIVDEEITTEKLRDSIHEQIEHLEKITAEE